ncbi:LCP family protein [Lachnobacterium bovis]|jgi:LCP family protein required for cell wall assembly|uniref:Transcriptional attenuator, LytR family n=1 Tax=Lachnobacterium bovis DSM 14045 TaxID=1122142 RepID=A0A1H3JQK3_9FIRM|nr:LCP family protein [Lachnobacterium bovis]SDY41879.1 transcriptional attenuator, LytR family [Lachnobacterium bovis DSM 14045]
MSKKIVKKRKRRKKIVIFAIEVIALAILLVILYIVNFFNHVQKGGLDKGDVAINKEVADDSFFQKGQYTNIALFGLDNRGSGQYDNGNSDTIMIASINNENKKVKLISVYRDTYLLVGKNKLAKANSAYAIGGVKNAVRMLNANLDLDIQNYVTVDWGALVKAIDALGGIDIEISRAEMNKINEYTVEIVMMTGKQTTKLNTYGNVHLDGTQATSYARIRKLQGDDYLRSSRQRIVLQAMLEKAKTAGITKLGTMVDSIKGDISTSLSTKDMISLISHVKEYQIESTTGFPFKLGTQNINGEDTVVPAELANNVAELHQYMFGDDDGEYAVSQNVESISNRIKSRTGYTSRSKYIVDTNKYNNTAGNNSTTGTIEKNEKSSKERE